MNDKEKLEQAVQLLTNADFILTKAVELLNQIGAKPFSTYSAYDGADSNINVENIDALIQLTGIEPTVVKKEYSDKYSERVIEIEGIKFGELIL